MSALTDILKLLETEKQEDIRQYQEQIVMRPLHERRQRGFTWYPVVVRHTEIGVGEQLTVWIERKSNTDQTHRFQVGDAVSLFHNSSEKNKPAPLPGVITSLWRNEMRIALVADELPEWMNYGNLGVDLLLDLASYQEMETALQILHKAERGTRVAQLREMIYGEAKIAFREDVSAYYYVESLNASQNLALRQVLAADDIAIIHGPPGTGKTTTLVEAVKLTLQTEKQVLVTAPSNTAVDLLTERLMRKGLFVLRIGNPARIDEELMSHALEAQIAQHPDYRHLKKIRRDAEEYRKMAGKYKRNFGAAEREQRQLLYAEANKLRTEAAFLEKHIVDSLLNNAQVITATLVGAVNKYIRHRRYSTVFIDEAGQALEPATWIPMLKAERVVMAGDPHQLPPTVKSQAAARGGLSQTLLEKIIAKHPHSSVMLETQYRMHEQIMGFSNRQFYQNRLRADAKVAAHSLLPAEADFALLNQVVAFIDTAGCGFAEQQGKENVSYFNPEEANILLKHLGGLLTGLRWANPRMLDHTFSVGIISPYAAQVAHLQAQLKHHPDLLDFQEFIDVNTVDGFQGQEREVMYISLVRSNDTGQIGFLADTRRLNVALTRARKKLVVLGDSATLGAHPFYASFLQYIDEIGAYHSAWEWLEG